MQATTNDTDLHSNSRTSYLTDRPARKKDIQWKAWAWKIGSFPFLAIVYVSVISDGLRRLVPELGVPLWRAVPLPGFSLLRNYEGLRKLDLAHMLSLILLFASWFMWVAVLRTLFFPRDFAHRAGLNLPVYTKFVFGLACVILVCDSSLFYYALVNGGIWGGNAFMSFPALLATCAYTALLVFVSYVTLHLED
jgi:hypothetical protein